MLIISVEDNKNNRQKRNAKTKPKQQQQQNRTRGMEAMAKRWEINDFVEHLI